MTDIDVRSSVDPLKGMLSRSQIIPATSTNTAAITGIRTVSSEQVLTEVEVEVELGTGASWLAVFIGDINRVSQLPTNWDSYGGARLRDKAARHAIELLQRVDFAGPAPWVSPTPDGDLHLEWNRAGMGLELEVTEDGSIHVLVEEAGQLREWATGSFGDDELRSVLRRLTDSRPN